MFTYIYGYSFYLVVTGFLAAEVFTFPRYIKTDKR